MPRGWAEPWADCYAGNTLGAILGAILGGFVIIPVLGVQAAIKAGIVTNLGLAVTLVASASVIGPPRPASGVWRWGALGATLAVAVGVSVWTTPWDPRVLSSGPAIYGKDYLRAGRPFADVVRQQDLLFYGDGRSSTVSVRRAGSDLLLQVNGKTEAGTGWDIRTQLLLGHLPLLVHPDPRTVLVIGLGSGVTAGAVAGYPITRLDIAEIEPAVVEASRFFAGVNGDVVKDPRVHLKIADGRNYLLTTRDDYDVIISEPSNPWTGGRASLFSVEFFRLARAHLHPGGIMCQWLQGYNLLQEDLRMVVRTFRTAFPATSVWYTSAGDLLLLGRVEPTAIRFVLVAQPRKLQPGQVMTPWDLKDSVDIFSDSDQIILLHRELVGPPRERQAVAAAAISEADLYSPITLVRLAKARHRPGRDSLLYCIGAEHRFRETTPEDLQEPGITQATFAQGAPDDGPPPSDADAPPVGEDEEYHP